MRLKIGIYLRLMISALVAPVYTTGALVCVHKITLTLTLVVFFFSCSTGYELAKLSFFQQLFEYYVSYPLFSQLYAEFAFAVLICISGMRFARYGKFLLAGILPTDSHDIITNKETRTYKSYLERPPSTETGWDRLKEMFQLDEFGNISPGLNSIYQAGFTGFLFGMLYGGFIHSREAYISFMENNQATAFKSHLDAKRKLQDNFTVSFAKGGFKWGWRVGLFTTSYFGIITLISVYREKSSIYEYLAAGSITGALYKFNMGLKGMAAGGIVGCALGGIGGVASLILLKLSGTSMEEMRYWQYKWRLERSETVQEALKFQGEQESPTPDIIKLHDQRLQEKKLSLENLDSKPTEKQSE